jgi:hypothetical protein
MLTSISQTLPNTEVIKCKDLGPGCCHCRYTRGGVATLASGGVSMSRLRAVAVTVVGIAFLGR